MAVTTMDLARGEMGAETGVDVVTMKIRMGRNRKRKVQLKMGARAGADTKTESIRRRVQRLKWRGISGRLATAMNTQTRAKMEAPSPAPGQLQ